MMPKVSSVAERAPLGTCDVCPEPASITYRDRRFRRCFDHVPPYPVAISLGFLDPPGITTNPSKSEVRSCS